MSSSVSSEREASIFQRRTEAVLHPSHSSRRQGQVLPHLHVHLAGRRIMNMNHIHYAVWVLFPFRLSLFFYFIDVLGNKMSTFIVLACARHHNDNNKVTTFVHSSVYLRSPTPAQTRCSPSRLETGTSPKSWPITRTAS